MPGECCLVSCAPSKANHFCITISFNPSRKHGSSYISDTMAPARALSATRSPCNVPVFTYLDVMGIIHQFCQNTQGELPQSFPISTSEGIFCVHNQKRTGLTWLSSSSKILRTNIQQNFPTTVLSQKPTQWLINGEAEYLLATSNFIHTPESNTCIASLACTNSSFSSCVYNFFPSYKQLKVVVL